VTAAAERQILTPDVVVDVSLYPREQVSEARVEEFVKLLEEDREALPPIVVVADDERLVLADGRHRLVAMGRLGIDSCRAQVLEVPQGLTPSQHVLVVAIDAVTAGGLPLSPAGRKRARDLLLEHYPALSSAEVARRVGMTRQSVSSTRSARRQQPSPRPANPAVPEDPKVLLVDRFLSAWQDLQPHVDTPAALNLVASRAAAMYGLKTHVTVRALAMLMGKVSSLSEGPFLADSADGDRGER